MKQKVVGQYYIGYEFVEIVLRKGDGGEFWVTPERGHIPRIKIGADVKHWKDIVVVLLHEATELVLCRLKCRYTCKDDMGSSHSSYLFSLDHGQFCDTMARIGDLITDCLLPLHKEWKKWKKKAKKEAEGHGKV